MLDEIEQRLSGYFGAEWQSTDVRRWAGETRFSIDLPSINATLRAPLGDFLLRGGKRVRPILFLTLLRLFGIEWRKYLDVAIALELAHNATLIIDDIEDSALLRRGKPTCHIAYGLDTAVNAGVAAHSLPLRLLLATDGLDERQRLRLVGIYAEEIANVYLGQTLDISWHRHPRMLEVEEYLEMTRLKTGGLLRMASRMACVIAGREDLEAAMVRFSEMVGIAFQIKDDALEFESDEATFGKSVGNDITEGKMSLPVTFALAKLPDASRAWLLTTLGAHVTEASILQKAMTMIRETGAVSEAVAYAEKIIEDSWRELEPLLRDRPLEEVNALQDVTRMLVKRSK